MNAHRTTEIIIPTHWSTDQAEAIHDLLTELAARVWDRYERELVERICLQQAALDVPHHHDHDDADDDIPW